jgi:hypothetical protein
MLLSVVKDAAGIALILPVDEALEDSRTATAAERSTSYLEQNRWIVDCVLLDCGKFLSRIT